PRRRHRRACNVAAGTPVAVSARAARRLRRRETHPRECSAAFSRPQVERPAMQARNAVHDGKAQSRARRTTACRLATRKGAFQSLDFVRWNAWTTILDVDDDRVVIAARRDAHGWATMAPRVVEQIGQQSRHRRDAYRL